MRKTLQQLSAALLAVLVASCFAGCSDKTKKERAMTKADEYFARGDYQKAEIEYLNVLQASPWHPNSVVRLGHIYFAQGRSAEAYAYLAKAREISPDDLDSRTRLAMLLLATFRHAEARKESQEILAKNPRHEQALLLLVDTIDSQDAAVATKKKLTEMLASGIDTWAIHTALARLELHQGNVAGANAEIEKAARMNDKAPEVSAVRAAIAASQNDVAAVTKNFEKARTDAPPRSPQKLTLARFKMQQRDYAGAKALLDELLKETPDFISAAALRGQLALMENDVKECDRITDGVLSWAPKSYEMKLLKSRSLLIQKQPAKAIEQLEQLNVIYPDTPELKYEIAVAQATSGSIPAALKNLDDAIRLSPAYTEAVVLRSEIQLREGMPDQVISSLRNFTKQFPEIDAPKDVLARAYVAKGRSAEALQIYETLTARYTNVPQLHVQAGAILRRQTNFARARAEFDKALALTPNFLPAVHELINLHLQQGNVAAADQVMQQHAGVHKDVPEMMLVRAKVELAARRTNDAIATLKALIAKSPEVAPAYASLARLYLSLGQTKQALAEMQRIVEKDPSNAGAHMQIGVLEEALENFAGAKQSYETVVKLRPGFASAWNNLAYVLAEHLNDLDGALKAAVKARELNASDMAAADTLGWIHFKKGNLAQALGLLRESAARLPGESEVAYHLAEAEYKAGNEAQARAACETFLRLPGANAAQKKQVEQRLATLNFTVENPAAALPALEAAAKADATDGFVAIRLGRAYEKLGQIEKARDAFERAVKLNPSATEPTVRLAVIYSTKLKDAAKATEFIRNARKVAPNDPEITGLAATMEAQLGNHPGALALLQEKSRGASTVDPHDMALAYFNVGRFDQAIGALTEPRVKRSESAEQLLTVLNYITGKTTRSVVEPVVRTRLANNTDDSPGRYAAAMLSLESQKFDEAVGNLERIVARNKHLPQAQRQLAITYEEKLGNHQKALEHGGKAVQAFPGDAELVRAVGKAAFNVGDFTTAAGSFARLKDDPEAQLFLAMCYQKTNRRADATNILLRLASSDNPRVANQAKQALGGGK